jgi:hypothetical protein
MLGGKVVTVGGQVTAQYGVQWQVMMVVELNV